MFSGEKREANTDASIGLVVTVKPCRTNNLLGKPLTNNKATKIVSQPIREEHAKNILLPAVRLGVLLPNKWVGCNCVQRFKVRFGNEL